MTSCNKYYFLNNSEKVNLLVKANEILKINNNTIPLIFVYSAPKVGSTSIVSSLRIFAVASKYYESFNLCLIYIHATDDDTIRRNVQISKILHSSI